jgi:beta-ketoacyl-acyl-carrier-protein synthase II
MKNGPDGRKRVVITGMGAITPLAHNVEDYWQALAAGRSGLGPITMLDAEGYPVHVAAEVKGFDPEQYIERRDARRMARFSQFAVAAAQQAVAQAEFRPGEDDPARVGVLLGNGIGGFPNIDAGVRTIIEKGGMRMDPFFFLKSLPNMAAANLSMRYQAKGYSGTICTACAASTQAMGEAAEVIRRGYADVMLTGGTEAGICELGMAGFSVMKVLSPHEESDAGRASRPFDALRDGFVSAEGAGIFVIESLEHARRRGAHVLAELIGFAATADAYHMVAPCADGEGAARCIGFALKDAGVAPEEIDYINAHGTSTPIGDASETRVIKIALGEEKAYRTPVSSTKGATGHCLGASGAVEAIISVFACQRNAVPPTINYEYPDPDCDLDYIPNEAREWTVDFALSNNFGFGGHNACLIFTKFK